MVIERYTAEKAAQWDALVEASRNGTFLFMRGYMDYHSDRFVDHSLMAYDDKGKLMAVLPANEVTEAFDGKSQKVLFSHQGLTYGGWVLNEMMGANEMLSLFGLLLDYLRSNGFVSLRYKPMPSIYQRWPAQEDLYALWRMGARIDVCNLATTLDLRAVPQLPVEQRRRRGARKASNLKYSVIETEDITEFWPIVEQNLRDTYGASPVHTLQEMQLLKCRFPKAIRCFVAKNTEGRVEGGIILQESHQVAHSQYPHATPLGKRDGVMDLVFSWLIDYYGTQCPDIRYFDFGTSNEQQGRYLNPTLVAQKEGFGGRGIAYYTFRLDL